MSNSSPDERRAELRALLTKEVEVEGCQAQHDGERCLHCNIEPCPHCKQWGGQSRTESRVIVSDEVIDKLSSWHENAVAEYLNELIGEIEMPVYGENPWEEDERTARNRFRVELKSKLEALSPATLPKNQDNSTNDDDLTIDGMVTPAKETIIEQEEKEG